MKRVLADTHALLWFLFDDARLSKRADKILADAGIQKFFSLVSLWEIAIKLSLDKLALGMTYDHFVSDYIDGRAVDLLDIRVSHLRHYVELPLHHQDPFDRLLVCQCMQEKLPLLTADPWFTAYGIEVIW